MHVVQHICHLKVKILCRLRLLGARLVILLRLFERCCRACCKKMHDYGRRGMPLLLTMGRGDYIQEVVDHSSRVSEVSWEKGWDMREM